MEGLGLLPPDMGPLVAGVLVAAAFFTSAITAAFGLGGGVALLLVMAFFLPVATLIPVHGVVQLGSNVGRAIIQRAHVLWPILLAFGIGSVLGAMLGAVVVVSLPDDVVKAGVALFVLYMVWGKVPALPRASYGIFALGGLVATVLTMFFGATGPFVAAILKPVGLARHNFVGTHAASMVVQHGLKIIVFGFLGFAFGPWLVLLAAMIGAGFLGTIAGSWLLDHMSEALFRRGFDAVMTVLALYLLWQTLPQIL